MRLYAHTNDLAHWLSLGGGGKVHFPSPPPFPPPPLLALSQFSLIPSPLPFPLFFQPIDRPVVRSFVRSVGHSSAFLETFAPIHLTDLVVLCPFVRPHFVVCPMDQSNKCCELLRMPWHLLLINTITTCLSQKEVNGPPIILGWNNFFDQGNVIRTIAPKEQVERCRRKCEYSEDRQIAQNASVIVFHEIARGVPPAHRRPDQLYVMFDLEAPSRALQFPAPNFFNLTMTYLANDEHNLIAPYGSLRKIERQNPKRKHLEDIWTWGEVLEKVGRKDKMALQIASNCVSHSGREAYTKELSKHIEVTGYGRCFGRNCDKKCYDTEIDRHFFYLAFENSVCRNYVTEKFWNALRHLTVPVVLSRKALKGLDIPPEAFVAADDFGTVEEMAKFLEQMRFDQNKYLRFFNWTRFFRRKSDINPTERAICMLCELAHQRMAPGSKVIANIDQYWRLQANCGLGFAAQLAQKRPILNKVPNSIRKCANECPAGLSSLPITFLCSISLLLFLAFLLLIALFLRRFFNLPFSLSIKSPRKMIKFRSPIVFFCN